MNVVQVKGNKYQMKGTTGVAIKCKTEYKMNCMLISSFKQKLWGINTNPIKKVGENSQYYLKLIKPFNNYV